MRLTARTARRAAVAALACAAIAAPAIALAAPNSPTTTRSTALALPCETPGLVMWMDTNGNGSAGHIDYNLRFTNLSGHACTLNGFPYLYAVNLAGHQVGHIATFSTAHPTTVTIGNGRTAHAVLQIADVGAIPSCHPVNAAGLKVFPPNQQRAKIVPFPLRACSATSPIVLKLLKPVVAGPGTP